jgi:hypothetical protein
MRGKYHMMDWEEAKLLKDVSAEIEKIKNNQIEEVNLTSWDACPANIRQTLYSLGWTKSNYERNGWECDTWWYFKHKDYDFELVLFYCGDTFEMELWRGGKD